MLAAQRDRWILWLPIGVVAGAAAWLSAPVNPPLWLGAGALASGALLAGAAAFWPSARPDG
ncbi:MAG: hypothetical protein AB7L65_04400, partial [Hyphomonadaceae bacterium]